MNFVREPKEEEYGTMTVFEDLYGNKWDLLEPKPLSSSEVRAFCGPEDPCNFALRVDTDWIDS